MSKKRVRAARRVTCRIQYILQIHLKILKMNLNMSDSRQVDQSKYKITRDLELPGTQGSRRFVPFGTRDKLMS